MTYTTAIRQVWLPLTRSVSPEEQMFAYSMPREREKFDAKDKALAAAITKAESEIEDLLNDGFSFICDHVISTHQGQFLHCVLVKRTRDDE